MDAAVLKEIEGLRNLTVSLLAYLDDLLTALEEVRRRTLSLIDQIQDRP